MSNVEYLIYDNLIVGLSTVTEFLQNFIKTETMYENMLMVQDEDNKFMESLENSLERVRECIGLDNVYIAYARYPDKQEPLMTMIVYFDPYLIGVDNDPYNKYEMQYHIGIHRNVRHIYYKIDTIRQISFFLQIAACWGIDHMFGENDKRFVVINPLPKMEEILYNKLESLNIPIYPSHIDIYDDCDILTIEQSKNENDQITFVIEGDKIKECICGALIAFRSILLKNNINNKII